MNISEKTSVKLHAVLVCALVGFSVIRGGLLNILRSFVHLPAKLDVIIIYGILFLIVFLLLRYFLERLDLRELIPFLIIFALIIYSWLSNFSYSDYYLRVIGEYLLGVCAYIVIRTIDDTELVLRYLRITAFFITVCCFAVMGYSLSKNTYSQSLGYHILPAVVISFDALLDKSAKLRILHLINFVFSFFICFMTGARGPVVAVAVFILLRLIFGFGSDIKRQFVVLLVTAVIIVLFLVYFDEIYNFFFDIAQKYGLSTRVFRKYENGVLFDNTSRRKFYNYSIGILNSSTSNFVFGTGICKDRILLAEQFSNTNNAYAYYPHNLFVEFILQFGVILGALLSVFVIYVIIKGLFSKIDREVKNFFTLFLAVGFVPLMFSMSYVTEPLFFCMIGAGINCIENSNYHKTIDNTH